MQDTEEYDLPQTAPICERFKDLIELTDGGDSYREACSNDLTNDEKVEEYTKCANSFKYFAENYVFITHPKRGLLLFKLYEYQQRCIHDYDNYKHNIIRKFRQGGLTTLTVIWALWRCMFRNDQKIMVLSKSDREAKSAGKIVTNVLKYLPDWLKPEVELDNQHEKVFSDTNGSVEFWTCEAARSKSLTYLIIDEAAFIKNMDEHWKSMYPTLATGGSCIVISTVNGLGNWYEEWYHTALAGKNMFHVIDIEYKENPEYSNEEWAKEMRANLGERGWRQEVLGDFLGSGETYVKGEALTELSKFTVKEFPKKKLFPEWENDDTGTPDDWKMLNNEYNRGAFWIWEEPEDGVEYILSADVSHGVQQDNSGFVVFRKDTMEQVAEFYSNIIPANEFAQVIANVGNWYKDALVIVEAAEEGLTVLNKLETQISYDNLYFENRRNTASAGVNINKKTRPIFLEQLKSCLENKYIKVRSYRLVRELKTFIVQARKPQAQRGKHDDLVMALAIMLGVIETNRKEVPVGAQGMKGTADINIDLTRSDVFLKVKAALAGGSIEDFMIEDNDDEEGNLLDHTKESNMMANVMAGYKIKRPYEALLREFDW